MAVSDFNCTNSCIIFNHSVAAVFESTRTVWQCAGCFMEVTKCGAALMWWYWMVHEVGLRHFVSMSQIWTSSFAAESRSSAICPLGLLLTCFSSLWLLERTDTSHQQVHTASTCKAGSGSSALWTRCSRCWTALHGPPRPLWWQHPLSCHPPAASGRCLGGKRQWTGTERGSYWPRRSSDF